MSDRSEIATLPSVPSPAVHSLRGAAFLFLLYHAFLHFEELISLPLLLALTGTAFLFALVAAAGALRAVPALLIGAALAPLLRALVFFAFGLLRSSEPDPSVDALYAFFDRTFFPALLPFSIAYCFTFLAARFRSFLPWEIGANALFLLVVFASERGFAFSLYGNSLSVAAAILLFVLLEGGVLVADGGRGRRGMRDAVRFGMFAVPILVLLLFALLGRFTVNQGARQAGLLKPTLLRFDFADYVNLESEIGMSRDLVFLARVEGNPDRLLFKRYSLGGYSPRRGFFRARAPGEEAAADAVPTAPMRLPDPGFAGREDLRQEFFFLRFDSRSLVSLDYPVATAPLPQWESSSFEGAYRVMSRRSAATPSDLFQAGGFDMDPAQYAFYTEHGENARVRSLAEEITAGLSSYYVRVTAIYRFLRDNYYYSLRPGVAADGDQLNHFLFESRKGYCSYFAFSMVLLLRSIGIPARVAVGFYADPAQRVLDFYPVRSDMAHAWVEVPFGRYGWIEFDPTSRTVAPGEEDVFGDAPPPESLSALLAEIGRNRPTGVEGGEGDPVLAVSPDDDPRPAGIFPFAVGLFVLIPAASAAAGAIPWFRYRTSRDPRRRMRHLFRHALNRCARAGFPIGRESPEEYALRVSRERNLPLVPLARCYQQARFAPNYSAADLSRGESSYRAFRVAYRCSVPSVRRAMALLLPRRVPRRFL